MTRRACVLSLLPFLAAAPPAAERFDVVVYGGTAAGVVAAVQARRMGRTVVLLEPGRHLGGLTSGGLGNTDIGNKGAVGGLSRRFYERVAAHYARPEAWVHETREEYERRSAIGNQGHGRPDPVAARTGVATMWVFEPRVAESILRRMAEEAGVVVRHGERLDLVRGVTKKDGAIASVRMESGRVYEGRAFVDATYEGDLMAKAGVSYRVGREANAVYGETLNGVQTRNAKHHQFEVRVDPYVVPGDPKSGLLPGIHDGGPGEEGSGDRRVQAYNFRMTLTDAPANRLPIPRPEGYAARRYELLRRYVAAGVFDAIDLNSPMPNRKTDVNNHGAFSSDHIGASDDYPDAGHAARERIFRDHRSYVMGLWYFLQNDERLPAAVREKAGRWGLCRDEFEDAGHWPHALYVREARRMVADVVMTEHHCRGNRRVEDSVGLAAYGMDSHNVQRYVEGGAARNEGDVQVGVAGPYPVSYRAIVPRRAEARNLLVPVALSASHIAYGSIRMEPVFMILAQSAATAASLALDGNGVVQDVPYARLRERLLADGQILEWDAAPAPPPPPAVLGLDGQPDPRPDAALADLVRKECGACHAVPSPADAPRAVWRQRLQDMKRFSLTRVGLPPGKESALATIDLEPLSTYFEARAPETLPSPEPWPPADPAPFERRLLSPPGAVPVPIVAATQLFDLDGDGRLEIVASDFGHGLVLLGDPRRSPGELREIARVPNPARASMADLDADGRRDLLVADVGYFLPEDHEKGTVVWLRQAAPGQFEKHVLLERVPRATDVEAADFDGDGDLDLVVAAFGLHTRGGILLLENRTTDGGEPRFEPTTVDERAGALQAIPADLDRDGRMDFVALLAQQHEAVVAFLNRGRGTFEKRPLFAARTPAWGSTGIDLVDFDGDGDLDVLATNGATLDDATVEPWHGVRWLENRGALAFDPHELAALPGAHRARAADLDGDGDLDVAAAAFLPDPDHTRGALASLVWLERRPDGSFARHTLQSGQLSHTTLDAGDVDGDGDADLATGSFTGFTFARTDPGFRADGWVELWENGGPRPPR